MVMKRNNPETVKARYNKHKSLGLCVKCVLPSIDGKTLCHKHQKYQALVCKSQPQEQKRKWAQEMLERTKALVFAAYDQKCSCCPETEIKFLTIDHVNGDGYLDKGKSKIWQRVKNEGFPPKYRILCMNCNHAMGIWGYCPHGTLPRQNTQHPANKIR